MRYVDVANGDPCPQSADHGRMHFVGAVQFCPNAKHVGRAIYRRDGVTLATPQSAQAYDSPLPSGLSTAPQPASIWEGATP